MKKIKIMLLSLALFAIVGGALAFKAKFNNDWCVAPLYGNGFTCTTLVDEVKTTIACENRDGYVNGGHVLSCTTIPDLILDCNTNCPILDWVGSNQ